jgi:outer membrane biosynthesis protein TonB
LFVFLAAGSYFLMQREAVRTVTENNLSQNLEPVVEEADVTSPEEAVNRTAAAATEEVDVPQGLPEHVLAETIPPEDEHTGETEVADHAQEAVADSMMLAEERADEEAKLLDAVAVDAAAKADTLALAGRTARPALKTREGTTLDGFTGGNVSERRNAARTPYPEIGMAEYRKYLQKALVRPATEACAKAKGVVKVEFYLDETGKPHNFRIGKKLCEEADKEAIRLVESGCLWIGDARKKITVEVSF